ncbi:MAG: GMC family oxidoreductase [Actinomycetota bacterium]|nr:GMC family oxidoreductase [Actinomycetota bacterium]
MDYDVIIIGSGFGGSVSAMRLADKGYRVCVIEAGKRWEGKDFPRTNWNPFRSLWFPKLGMRGIQRLSLLKHVMALSGVGVGGGSLVYANTHYEPLDPFYSDGQWADVTDWKDELAPYFDLARSMLGVTQNPLDTPADIVMRSVAAEMEVAGSFSPTPVAVYFGESGVEVDDPYFGGEGPRRSGCVACGNCMVGCRFNAKNTLDKNYLWFAERAGAHIMPEQQVNDVEEIAGGWAVSSHRPGAWMRKGKRRTTATHVIFSAGALGTTRLLLELAERGRIPNISSNLGHLVRTNSEAILGAVANTTEVDYSEGIAITSSIHLNDHTHVEPVRYGKGSNALGLLSTVLTDGGPGLPRPIRFLRNVVRHPIAFLRSLSVWKWSERTIILLVMQSSDNSLRLIRKRGLFGMKLSTAQSHGEPSPTYIHEANDVARATARIIGGQPMSAIHEVLFDTPTTAHLLGGAPVGSSPNKGVVDAYHRVFGHKTLHVIDGAAIGANLGVNPSLTITAMAERAVNAWPRAGEPDSRPAQGDPYQRIAKSETIRSF